MIYAFVGSCDEIKNCLLCENGKFLVLEDDKYIKITKPLLKKYVLIIIIQLCINILNILLDKLILNNIIS